MQRRTKLTDQGCTLLDVRGLLPSLCDASGGGSCGVAVGGGGWRCWWRRFIGLSVRGSSMLSMVKECCGGQLLSRHRAWWREGKQMERDVHNAFLMLQLFKKPCFIHKDIHRHLGLLPPPFPVHYFNQISLGILCRCLLSLTLTMACKGVEAHTAFVQCFQSLYNNDFFFSKQITHNSKTRLCFKSDVNVKSIIVQNKLKLLLKCQEPLCFNGLFLLRSH